MENPKYVLLNGRQLPKNNKVWTQDPSFLYSVIFNLYSFCQVGQRENIMRDYESEILVVLELGQFNFCSYFTP